MKARTGPSVFGSGWWWTAGLLIAAIAGAALHEAGVIPDSMMPRCLFHEVTGLHCPGCGSGRAIEALLRGHIVAACGKNVLAMFLLPLVLYELLRRAAARWLRLPDFFSRPWFGWSVFWVTVIFGIARNIPVYPLNLLAP